MKKYLNFKKLLAPIKKVLNRFSCSSSDPLFDIGSVQTDKEISQFQKLLSFIKESSDLHLIPLKY